MKTKLWATKPEVKHLKDQEEEMEEAMAAVRAMVPPETAYADVPRDLVAGLQKRDFKHSTSLSPTLLMELGPTLLPSKVIPLSFEQATALFKMYPYLEGGRGVGGEDAWPVCVRALACCVDDAIVDMAADVSTGAVRPFDGIFVKLSFMSPKDAALRTSSHRTKDALRLRLTDLWHTTSFLSRLLLSSSSPPIPRLFVDSLYASLKVHSGRDAISLICSSSRCSEELCDSLISPSHFATSLIVRPWMQLRPGFEFRSFVSNGKLTCVSQYEGVYYPDVWREKDTIQRDVTTFLQREVIPRICHRLPSVVVDVVFAMERVSKRTHRERHTQTHNFSELNDSERNSHKEKVSGVWYVCELNPFAASTSACAFSWQDDKEKLFVGDCIWKFIGPPENDTSSSPPSSHSSPNTSSSSTSPSSSPSTVISTEGKQRLQVPDEWREFIDHFFEEKRKSLSFFGIEPLWEASFLLLLLLLSIIFSFI